jgi:phosphatidylglycerol:prolipoprotein diacylglycerol transferase
MSQFLNWWQHLPERMDPVLIEIGPIKLQYYGLMYIVAFATVYLLVSYRLRTESGFRISREQAKDLLTYMILGLIIGARLGYVVFYNLPYYLQHPLEIVLPFTFDNGLRFTGISGMSYHGGLIGVLAASWWYIRKSGVSFTEAADLFVPAIPLGYTFGRLGNFINGELYGRVTSAAVGMQFPLAPTPGLRHPSQLYEAFFEGIFLFAILWSIRRRKLPAGSMLGLYMIGYGAVRFVIEFFREPDAHLGLVWVSLSMGQLLCLAMILAGVFLLAIYRRRQPLAGTR